MCGCMCKGWGRCTFKGWGFGYAQMEVLVRSRGMWRGWGGCTFKGWGFRYAQGVGVGPCTLKVYVERMGWVDSHRVGMGLCVRDVA